MLDMNELINIVVRAYAEKHKIPEEQARAILDPILKNRNTLEELQRTLEEAEKIGEVMSKIPEDAKPIAENLLNQHIYGEEEEDDMISILREARKLAVQLKILDLVLGQTLGSNKRSEEDERIRRLIEENEKLRRENEELRKKIETILDAITEAKKRRELDELREQMEQLRERIESLRDDITIKLMETKNPKTVKSELETLTDTLRRFLEIQNMLKQLGAINEATKIPEELLEKIKNPPSSGEGIRVWLEALDKIIKLAQITSRKNTEKQPVISTPPAEETGEEEFVPIGGESSVENYTRKKPRAIIVGGENE